MWIPLVRGEAWVPAPGQADPVGDDVEPDAVLCGDLDRRLELGGLEIETLRCNYAVVQQPLLADIEEGAPLRLLLWWQSLVSLEPAEGHLALVIGEDVIWDERVAIPGPADVRELELASPVAAAAGAVVTFHLHNHGANTWNLNELALQVPARADSTAHID